MKKKRGSERASKAMKERRNSGDHSDSIVQERKKEKT